ncbi:hypothetical protein NCCP2165_14260 [Halomonas sp. NCCP-2165]|nr:hypothetical protein NCCP2165_14260 [Halomonas sp. NCCP-2165]
MAFGLLTPTAIVIVRHKDGPVRPGSDIRQAARLMAPGLGQPLQQRAVEYPSRMNSNTTPPPTFDFDHESSHPGIETQQAALESG